MIVCVVVVHVVLFQSCSNCAFRAPQAMLAARREKEERCYNKVRKIYLGPSPQWTVPSEPIRSFRGGLGVRDRPCCALPFPDILPLVVGFVNRVCSSTSTSSPSSASSSSSLSSRSFTVSPSASCSSNASNSAEGPLRNPPALPAPPPLLRLPPAEVGISSPSSVAPNAVLLNPLPSKDSLPLTLNLSYPAGALLGRFGDLAPMDPVRECK